MLCEWLIIELQTNRQKQEIVKLYWCRKMKINKIRSLTWVNSFQLGGDSSVIVHLHTLTVCCFQKMHNLTKPLYLGKAGKKKAPEKQTNNLTLMSWKTNSVRTAAAADAGNSDPSALKFPYCGPVNTAGLWLNQSGSLWPTSHWIHLPAPCACLQATLCHQNWSKFNMLNADSVWALSKTLYQATDEAGTT